MPPHQRERRVDRRERTAAKSNLRGSSAARAAAQATHMD
jgi:hypothetical protein